MKLSANREASKDSCFLFFSLCSLVACLWCVDLWLEMCVPYVCVCVCVGVCWCVLVSVGVCWCVCVVCCVLCVFGMSPV